MVSAGQPIRASDVAVQACRVNRTTNVSIPDATYVTVAFTAERFDTDGMHSTVTNTSRITIQTAGIYVVGFSGRLTSANDYSIVQALISLNGGADIVQAQIPGTPNPVPQRISVNAVWQFEVGDYIEVKVYQDNTSNVARDLEVTATYSPEFYAARIGS